jgi:L-2-hydroxyglutarate oxidase LhgO
LITITTKIKEEEDGVTVHITAFDVGTTRETVYAKVIMDSIGYASKWLTEQSGGIQTEHTLSSIMRPLKGGDGLGIQ